MSKKKSSNPSALISGLWLGEALLKENSQFSVHHPIKWSLSLESNCPYPSAFGVAVCGSTSDTSRPLNILRGTWDYGSNSITLTQVLDHDNETKEVTYNGTMELMKNDNEWLLRGQWTKNTQQGIFACRREDDAINLVSGLWVGQAQPDPSLAPFCIPTNPIKWSLSLISNVTDTGPTAFGAGFFNDSADIANQPVLFYKLSGDWEAKTNRITLVKRYENHPATDGYVLNYTGILERRIADKDIQNHSLLISGKWKNEKAGTFGSFVCHQQKVNGVYGVCLCDMCQKTILPSEISWNCTTCPVPWNCCNSCYDPNNGVHEHELIPETMHSVQKVDGANCADLIDRAFKMFSKRQFLGTRKGTKFSYITYKDVQQYVLDLVYALQIRELGSMRYTAVIIMDLSPAYVVAMLACVMYGFILVPLSGHTDLQSLQHILSKTKSTVFFVDKKYRRKVLKAVRNVHGMIRLLVTVNEPILSEYVFSNEEKILPDGTGPVNKANLTSVSFPKMLNGGAKARLNCSNDNFVIKKVALDDLSAILFTSGSTGVPKGAMFTEDLVIPVGPIASVQPFVRLDYQSFDPSFLLSILSTMRCGGRRAFTNTFALMKDLPLVRRDRKSVV